MHKFLLVWPGQEEERIINGIKEITPTELYFLLESRTSDWIEFQRESLKNIIDYFGKLYELDKKAHEITFELNGHKPEEHSKIIFGKIHEVISDIRKTYPDAKIFLDSTSVPKPILLIFTFVAMTLSTDKSPILLQSVPKAEKLDPIYYASSDSKYYKTHVNLPRLHGEEDMGGYVLSEYRKKEKSDVGGDPIEIKLPHNKFAILNSIERISTKKDLENLKLLALFSVLPSYKQDPLSSKEIAIKLYNENKELFKKVILPAEKNQSFKIWVGKNLEKLRMLSLITLERPNKNLIAKKTWGGDLISGATDKLYAEIESKHFKK